MKTENVTSEKEWKELTTEYTVDKIKPNEQWRNVEIIKNLLVFNHVLFMIFFLIYLVQFCS